MFSFIKFENPLYFVVRKKWSWRKHSQYPSDLKLMLLETLRHRERDHGDCLLKFESGGIMPPPPDIHTSEFIHYSHVRVFYHGIVSAKKLRKSILR